MERVINYLKENNRYVYLIILMVFTFIAYCSPITGDDWGNVNRSISLYSTITMAYSMYFSYEGRFISRILITLFASYKWIWDIIFPLLFTYLIYKTNKYINKKDSLNVLLLLIISLLFVNHTMFAQVYTWIAGNATYFIPTVITIIYFISLFKSKGVFKKWQIVLIIITNIIGTMFVENIGVALVFGNLLYFLYELYKNKKCDWLQLCFTLISIASLYIMYKSPGSVYRMNLTPEFASLNIFQKIYKNASGIIRFTYERNLFAIGLMIIPIYKNILMNTKSKKKRTITCILFAIVPIITILNNINIYLPVEINIFDINISRYIVALYWALFTILFFMAISKSRMNKDDKIECYGLMCIGLSSMAVMVLSPDIGERVGYLCYICMNIVAIKMIDTYPRINSNIVKKILTTTLVILIVYYVTCFAVVIRFTDEREKNIATALSNNEEIINIKSNPILLVWNNNPCGDGFHTIV